MTYIPCIWADGETSAEFLISSSESLTGSFSSDTNSYCPSYTGADIKIRISEKDEENGMYDYLEVSLSADEKDIFVDLPAIYALIWPPQTAIVEYYISDASGNDLMVTEQTMTLAQWFTWKQLTFSCETLLSHPCWESEIIDYASETLYTFGNVQYNLVLPAIQD